MQLANTAGYGSIIAPPWLIACTAAGALSMAGAQAGVIVVPDEAPTIQAGIDKAVDGDTVLVRAGTYHERIHFRGRDITVRAEDGPEMTVIDGEQTGTVVTMASGLLEGFTVTHGHSVMGGGLVLRSGTARRCVFRQNTAEWAGGGIHLVSGDVVQCVIEENTEQDFWGGGGIWVGQSGLATAAEEGPCVSNTAPRIIDSRVARNVNDGIVVFLSELEVTGCLVLDNQGVGIGLCNLSGPNAVITNSTVSGNTGTGVGLCEGTVLQNSIVWGNGVDVYADEHSTVRYSDVRGGWPGEGNIDADPRFSGSPASRRLGEGSPCIDAADNTAVPPYVTEDLDGNPRFVDDPETDDTGHGEPPIVDMGAYEFQAASCSADLDGDGNVGFSDVLLMLVAWGQCAGCPEDLDGDGRVGLPDLLAVLAQWGPCPA